MIVLRLTETKAVDRVNGIDLVSFSPCMRPSMLTWIGKRFWSSKARETFYRIKGDTVPLAPFNNTHAG